MPDVGKELNAAALTEEAAEGYEVRFHTEHDLGGIEASVDKDMGTIFGIRLDDDGQMSVDIPASTKNRAEIASHLEDCYGEFGRARSRLLTMDGLVIVDSPSGIMMIDHGEGSSETPANLEVIVFSYALEQLEDRIEPLREFVRQITDVPLLTTNKAFDEVIAEGKAQRERKAKSNPM